MSDPIRPTPAPESERTATRAPSVASGLDETLGSAEASPNFAPPAAAGEVGKLGPYRILKQLGHGGMGAVYLGLDERLGRKLALKVMLPQYAANPAAKERFLREARAAAQITHDNVVTVYEADERDGVPFIAMQFLQGYPLDEFLKKKGRPTMTQVLRIARETAAGLAAAHKIGLVHRDIKPGNLWLEAPNGRVKVLDFGLARPVDAEAELTKSGAIIGTPAYMSPEQGRGQKVDPRTDLFSLGAVLYRLCTNKLPFDGPNVMAILTALSVDEPKPVRELNPDVPEPLADLIHQLLAKNPADRPQSADEVAKRIRGMVEKPASAANIPTASPQTPPVTYVPIPITMPPESVFADLGADDSIPPPVPHAPASPKKKRPGLLIGGALAFLAACALAGVIVIKITNKDGTVTEIKVDDSAKIEVGGKTINPDPKATTPKPLGGVATGYKNNVNMEFVKVPRGTGWLNGGSGAQGTTRVVIDQDFYLGKYEVTQGEWEAIMDATPSYFSRTGDGNDAVKGIPNSELRRFPVESVSWDDCQVFLERLNARDKTAGWVYRLPNASEWEYACRAATDDKPKSAFDYYFAKPTSALTPELANFDSAKGLKRTARVGLYEPNPLGLYDMHGNVWEWCEDPVQAPDGTTTRIHRGGGWGYDAANCRAAHGVAAGPKVRVNSLGLRVARVPAGPSAQAPAMTSDPDRKAAEYVLSVGGAVRVNDAQTDITARAELPREPFRLTWVLLKQNKQVADADLVVFKDCKHLTVLVLFETQVGDKGIENFAACKDLSNLTLGGSKVTDGGLVHFKNHKSLSNIDLSNTNVTDAGLATFKDCNQMLVVNLSGTKVTDAGMATLSNHKQLQAIDLSDTKVGDDGLANFKDFESLIQIYLWGTQITDAGLAHFGKCKGLTSLNVVNTPVTDKGMDVLKDCKNLTHLHISQTKITAAKFEELKTTFPKCKIVSDHGTYEPPVDPDRVTAEKLLPLFDLDILPAGKSEVVKLKAGSPVPEGAFAVTRVRCWSVNPMPRGFADEVLFPAVAPLTQLVLLEDSGSKVDMSKTDPAKWAGLASKESLQQFEMSVPLSDGWIDTFRQFPKLTAVHVHEAKKIPAATLKRLAELKALDSLRINAIEGLDQWEAVTALPLKKLGVSVAPNMDTAACARIAAMPVLDTVSFYDITFTAEMLAALAPAPKLRSLTFTKCKLPATGYEHLARMPSLNALNIKGDEFGDAQLAQFAEAKNLQFLSVKEAAVTEAGVKALATKRPNLAIEWAGGRVQGP